MKRVVLAASIVLAAAATAGAELDRVPGQPPP
jgi:hypothetical protein